MNDNLKWIFSECSHTDTQTLKNHWSANKIHCEWKSLTAFRDWIWSFNIGWKFSSRFNEARWKNFTDLKSFRLIFFCFLPWHENSKLDSRNRHTFSYPIIHGHFPTFFQHSSSNFTRNFLNSTSSFFSNFYLNFFFTSYLFKLSQRTEHFSFLPCANFLIIRADDAIHKRGKLRRGKDLRTWNLFSKNFKDFSPMQKFLNLLHITSSFTRSTTFMRNRKIFSLH